MLYDKADFLDGGNSLELFEYLVAVLDVVLFFEFEFELT